MQLYKVKLNKGGYLKSSGKVRPYQYPRGEAIKKARRFKGKIEKGILSEQGRCPKCESEEVYYSASELQDNMICYPYRCKNCNFEGKEWFELSFKYHTDVEGEEL